MVECSIGWSHARPADAPCWARLLVERGVPPKGGGFQVLPSRLLSQSQERSAVAAREASRDRSSALPAQACPHALGHHAQSCLRLAAQRPPTVACLPNQIDDLVQGVGV